MLTAIDHVQLAAPPGSEDLLRPFYTDTLGMTEVPKPPALAANGAAGSRPAVLSTCTSASRRTSAPPRRPTPA